MQHANQMNVKTAKMEIFETESYLISFEKITHLSELLNENISRSGFVAPLPIKIPSIQILLCFMS